LAIRSIWNRENQVDVQFLIKKDMINGAVLSLRCERRSEAGGSYIIRLRDYVQGINLPKKSLSEAVVTAEEFLRTEKLDVSKGVLLSAEFNEREPALWHITWVLADGRVDVCVSQDGSAKLNRGRSSPATLPKKSLMEAAATAEEFLRTQKLDISEHVLLKAEFKIYILNERERPFWEMAWVLGDQRVGVWVSQDGSAKLIRAR